MGIAWKPAMPLRTEHAARQLPPDGFVRFFRRPLAPGVVAVIGVDLHGRLRIQSVRLRSERFTPEEAQAWLSGNGFEAGIEPAATEAPGPPR
jgi:hypothetical protein